MWYVCDVMYAVLYVRFSCFVVRGCAVLRRYINVCNCDMVDVVNVVNVYLDHYSIVINVIIIILGELTKKGMVSKGWGVLSVGLVL